MWQVLFEIPGLGLRVHGFSVMLVVAAGSAVYLTAWRARREKINPDVVFELAVWLVSGGFIGARALYLAQHPEVVHSVWDVFKVWQGGIVFYGCIIGGLIGSLMYWARHPFPFRPMCDAVAPSLAIGIALGRVGCFLNGCCYGATSDLPWAITFPAGSLPWLHHVGNGWLSTGAARSLPIHPAQIYAILDGVILLGLLTAYYPRRRRDGEVMALLMVCYPVTRFLIERLRDDEGIFLAGMTISQFISALLFPCGLATWWYLSRQPLGRYADRVEAGSVPEPMSLRSSKPTASPIVR
jgi:phosphatidylglycerol---prolipoprotein diacylglyceryl transferase